jgi:hypothetical protein
MYVKNNFSNYFVLATILVYVLGFIFNSWHLHIDRDYSSITLSLQAAILGLYSLFYENGFLNANPCYQVFVIALITSYQTIVRIRCIDYQVYYYSHYFVIAWAALALVLYNKLPNILNYILRYEIGFSILSYILAFMSPFSQCADDTSVAIIAGLSVVFIFIPYLTFDRIAYYSSITLFSYMVTKALIFFISFIPYAPFNILYDILTFNITIGVIFAAALGNQYLNNKSQAILLEDDEEANHNADPTEY